MIMIAKNYIEFRFRLFWDTIYARFSRAKHIPDLSFLRAHTHTHTHTQT